MGRFGSFVLGVVVGAGSLYTTMHFHVVRFDDATRLVPKVTPGFAGTYADIRDYDVNDWRNHPELARAMLLKRQQQDERSNTMQGLQQRAGVLLGSVLGPDQSP